ncbi:MAG: chemotaxis protein CheB [Pseudomonadota bacterium]
MLNSLIAIGASTGGTDALLTFLAGLGGGVPPILMVQHMPKAYTAAFAERLDDLCKLTVREAQDGDVARPGLALLAPGGQHMRVTRGGGQYHITLTDDAPVSRHKPSVDVLFRSTAQAAGRHGIGVILTGMGADGARGLKAMRDVGAKTFGQDAQSCVVYGMPRAAKQHGAVQVEAELSKLPALVQVAYHAPPSMQVTLPT